ncbi:MAG: hypothetical protein Q7T87_12725 [Polaromonas sp.]|nr:hypothetical protein [Polaromonas sp.]
MFTFWKVAYFCFILLGVGTWISTAVDMLQGFVILPSRYYGTKVIPLSSPDYFWGTAVFWLVAGGLFVGLGVVGLRIDNHPRVSSLIRTGQRMLKRSITTGFQS